MGIRMSSNQFMHNYNLSLQRAYANQAKLFEQADGSSLHRPSDNSMAYHRYLRYQNSLNENEQYQDNVKNAMSWMKSSDDAIVHISDIMKTFKEKTIAAANDDKDEKSKDWEIIAKEMTAEIQEIVATSNIQHGDRFVFSGQRDLVQPFTLSTEKFDRGLTKTLDSDQINYFKNKVGKVIDSHADLNQMLTLEDTDGNTYYLDTESGNLFTKDFMDEGYKSALVDGVSLDDSAVGTLKGGIYDSSTNTDGFRVSDFFDSKGILKSQQEKRDENGYVISDLVGEAGTKVPGLEVRMIDDDGDGNYKLAVVEASDPTVVNTDYELQPDGTFTRISDGVKNFSAQTQMEDFDNSITMTDKNGNDVTLSFSTIKQYIVTYHGDENYISMVKLNGAIDPSADTVNLTGQDMYGKDIFDDENSGNCLDSDGTYVAASGCAMINEMLAVLAKTEAHDSDWISSDGVSVADVAHGTLISGETKLGARNQLYESVLTMLENQNDNITGDITDVSSTDVAKLAVKLMEMETLYNMSLSMGARVLPQTLADYL